MEANVESMQNLYDNMAEYGYDLTRIPFVIQYNKRDLPNAAPIKDLQAALNPGWPVDDAARQKVTPDPAHPGEHLVEQAGGQWVGHASYVEAVAVRGDGVFDTLKSVSKLVLKTLDRKSTRLNSSHGYISYAVFCLKKKKKSTRPSNAA